LGKAYHLVESNWTRVLATALLALLPSACGGSGARSAAAPAAPTPAPEVPARAEPAQVSATGSTATEAAAFATPSVELRTAHEVRAPRVPEHCEPGVEPCSTPARFVEGVCRGKYPELALLLLAKGTPWRRGYVKVQTLEPVNTYDGERSDEWLTFGEEVLILRTRGPSGGQASVQISGPTDVDVLRWDGTCATIRQEMLAPNPTNTSILTARVVWKYLDESVQQALVGNAAVHHFSEKERPACRGSTMKHPEGACDKASRKLTEAIAIAVRGGVALPTPAKLPVWED